MIHQTAIIDPEAKIGENVEIGPWTFIGPEVEIGDGTWVGSHVVIKGPCKIGKNNRIYQFSSIGEAPQDMKFQGERTHLEIGDHNTIREFCTLNRGTGNGGGVTSIGHHNLLMAYVHIAHDCRVGDHTIFSNNAALSGHVTVHDHVILGGFSAVHQFTVLGMHSFIAGTTKVVKDVLPFMLVAGNPAMPYGLNTVGLKRRGFSDELLSALRRAYKIIYRQGLTVAEAIEQLQTMVVEFPEIAQLIEALASSERGILR